MLDQTQATALLAALEAEHGPDLLVMLVGAAFRKDQADYHAEYAEANELPALDEWLATDSVAEDSYAWCAEICNHPAFGRIAGLR